MADRKEFFNGYSYSIGSGSTIGVGWLERHV
jgi:hypothetical protein